MTRYIAAPLSVATGSGQIRQEMSTAITGLVAHLELRPDELAGLDHDHRRRGWHPIPVPSMNVSRC